MKKNIKEETLEYDIQFIIKPMSSIVFSSFEWIVNYEERKRREKLELGI